jgi:uncharacterized protein (DUF1697 family)
MEVDRAGKTPRTTQIDMPKYIAFLRAINVGGHQVKMDQLRSLFEELGFTNVETFIASGNVIFDAKSPKSKPLESRIQKHLLKSLGYEVTTFIRSVSELAAIAKYEPFSPDDIQVETHTLYVAFLAEPLSKAAISNLLSKASAIDGFQVNDREIYWLYRRENGESKFYGTFLEKTIGKLPVTVRNVNTVQRLAKKYCK